MKVFINLLVYHRLKVLATLISVITFDNVYAAESKSSELDDEINYNKQYGVCLEPVYLDQCYSGAPIYSYDIISRSCKKHNKSLCKFAGSNNFESLNDCQDRCVPTTFESCEKLPNPGFWNGDFACNQNVLRYFYHKNECHPFIYTGCGGNMNNFANYRECLSVCRALKNGEDTGEYIKEKRKLPYVKHQYQFVPDDVVPKHTEMLAKTSEMQRSTSKPDITSSTEKPSIQVESNGQNVTIKMDSEHTESDKEDSKSLSEKNKKKKPKTKDDEATSSTSTTMAPQ